MTETESEMVREVEIGALRERVQIIEEPGSGPRGRIGRIRHANGENAAIDERTLHRLMERARESRERRVGHGRAEGCLWA